MSYLLGVDVGTTNLKVMAFDHNGRTAASASVKTPVLRPGPKMYEHDPNAIWEQVALGIRQVAQTLGPEQIDAIAIASVAEEGFLLGNDGQALAPAIAWYDQRTVPQATRWAKHFGSWETYRISGLLADSIYSLYKIQWIQARQPELYEQATKWLCMADYVTYRLSGEQAMTHSLASHTMALDLQRLEWSDEILKAAGVPRRLLPDLVPSGTLIGRVTPEAALVTGLKEGTPVVTGGHDHICGALAAGVLQPGSVLDSTGTAEALLVGLEHPDLSPTAFAAHIHFGAHTARGRFYASNAMSTGAIVDWVGDHMLAAADNLGDSYEALSAEAQSSPPGARGLFFLPQLSDVAFTDRDGWSKGAMIGLQLFHSRGDIFRAAFEGLTFELRVRLELLENSLGLGLQPRTVVSGGAARNALLLQLKANILERTVTVPAATETTALGAALLAGLGVGIYTDEADAIARTTDEAICVKPEPEQIPTYRTLFRTYTRLFDQMADTWHRWPWGPDGLL